LKRIVGPKKEVTRVGWRNSHTVEHHNLCSSHNIIRRIKSRIFREMRHVGVRGAMRNLPTYLLTELSPS
jgi:hypothetical protein